jgi:hypothetical protein
MPIRTLASVLHILENFNKIFTYSLQCQPISVIFLVSVMGVIIFNTFNKMYIEIFWKKVYFNITVGGHGYGSGKMIPIRIHNTALSTI